MHTERKTARTPAFVPGISLFVLGALAGWWLHDMADGPASSLVDATVAGESVAASPVEVDLVQPATGAGLVQGPASTFDALLQRAASEAGQDQRITAVNTLLEASLQAQDIGEQDLFRQRLATLVDALDRELTAAGRLDELDQLLEMITLSHPEIAGNFLKLGSLRLRTGSFDAALQPLAQIQNHPQLGAQARDMMRQAEESEVGPVSGEEIPLRMSGSQFIVDARLDDGAMVSLLVDTGAAMTVIDAATLTRLGYSLAGRREYFATAGGVVEAPVITLGRLSLGAAGINSLPVGALPLPLPAGIDGLLGMNFLRHFAFRIDQEQVVLFLDASN